MKGTLPALLIFGLDRMRGQLGHPTRVNSAWRCEAHNKRVGGATNSKHLLGRAADISIISAEIKIIEGVAGDLGLRVIPYLRENFVHVEI